MGLLNVDVVDCRIKRECGGQIQIKMFKHIVRKLCISLPRGLSTFYCFILPELATINICPQLQQKPIQKSERETKNDAYQTVFPFIDRQQYILVSLQFVAFVSQFTIKYCVV